MLYEKLCTVTLVANAALVKGDLGTAIKIVRDGATNNGKAAKVSAATDHIVGVLAQDGPFERDDALPVAILIGKIPVKVSANVQAGQVATVHTDGTFRSVGALANIVQNGMAAGVYLEDIANGNTGWIQAFPAFKS